MNYVELHIGDYDKATAHLTACEDGIYSRMIRRYYDTEAPLPADLKAIQRLVRARTREEKTAVATIASEFFQLTPGGFRHSRCDEEIARYQLKRDKARKSAEARWGTPENPSERNANASDPSMRTHCEGNARQSPVTSITPDTSSTPNAHEPTDDPPGSVGAFEGHDDPAPATPNPAAPLAIALRAAGVQVTPLNPDLIEAQREGVTAEALVELTKLDEFKGKPASYVIRAARRIHAEGAKPLATSTGESHARPNPRGESLAQRVTRKAIDEERARRANGQDDDGSLGSDDGALPAPLD